MQRTRALRARCFLLIPALFAAAIAAACLAGGEASPGTAETVGTPHTVPAISRSAEGPAVGQTATATTQVPPTTLQVDLSVETADGMHSASIAVELATTVGERARGLSNRDYLAPNDGMLFILPVVATSPFWMKDTYIPLDIAYLGPDGTIQEIRLGVPLDTELHYPAEPFRYALEMNGGWFAANGFAVGDRVVIPPALAGAGS